MTWRRDEPIVVCYFSPAPDPQHSFENTSSKMKKPVTTSRQIVRFLAAGGVAITTDFGVYYFLRNVLPVSGAKGVSFICGGVVAYLLNTYWVFEQRQTSSAGAVKFAVANTLLLGVNVLTNGGVLKVWPTAVAGDSCLPHSLRAR